MTKLTIILIGAIMVLPIISNMIFKEKEVDIKDIHNLHVSVNYDNHISNIHLTGLLFESSLGISNIEVLLNDTELNITVFKKLANNKYTGTLDYETTVPQRINFITFGNDRQVIWQNE